MRTLPAWRPAPPRLAQAATAVRVGVVDANGRPVSGAEVVVRAAGGEVRGSTDGSGVFAGQLPGGLRPDAPVEASARVDDYWSSAKSSVEEGRDGTIWIRFPVCLRNPILTTPEMVGLAAAVALTAAGFHWKIPALEITGEVFFGAVVFTSIYRLSCL